MFKNAAVVGMGWRWEPKKECNTISGGPSEYSPCKFPFMDHNGHKVYLGILSLQLIPFGYNTEMN